MTLILTYGLDVCGSLLLSVRPVCVCVCGHIWLNYKLFLKKTSTCLQQLFNIQNRYLFKRECITYLLKATGKNQALTDLTVNVLFRKLT